MEKNFRFESKDIALVCVKACFSEYADYCGFKLDECDKKIVAKGKFEIKEIAVLSRDRKKFVLLREFDKKKIRLCWPLIKSDRIINGETYYKKDFAFHVYDGDIEILGARFLGADGYNGKSYEDAEKENKHCIETQLATYVKRLEKQREKEVEEKKRGRDIYQAIFD